MKWYQEMLGSEELEKDPSLAGIFPLVLEDTQIAYNVVYEPAAMLPETGKSEKKDRINIFSEIENIQQVMEKIGIAYSQGYYFAKPERWEDIAGEIL